MIHLLLRARYEGLQPQAVEGRIYRMFVSSEDFTLRQGTKKPSDTAFRAGSVYECDHLKTDKTYEPKDEIVSDWRPAKNELSEFRQGL